LIVFIFLLALTITYKGLWFDTYFGCLRKSTGLCHGRRKKFEDLEDLLVSFRFYFIIVEDDSCIIYVVSIVKKHTRSRVSRISSPLNMGIRAFSTHWNQSCELTVQAWTDILLHRYPFDTCLKCETHMLLACCYSFLISSLTMKYCIRWKWGN
jgi:hypothetical protein